MGAGEVPFEKQCNCMSLQPLMHSMYFIFEVTMLIKGALAQEVQSSWGQCSVGTVVDQICFSVGTKYAKSKN